jgi:hypothetical protein
MTARPVKRAVAEGSFESYVRNVNSIHLIKPSVSDQRDSDRQRGDVRRVGLLGRCTQAKAASAQRTDTPKARADYGFG